MIQRKLFGVVLFCCLTLVQGCGTADTVVIHYRQSANLYTFELNNSEDALFICPEASSLVPGSSWMTAVYEITSIENKDKNPQTFHFYLNKVYTIYNLYSYERNYPGLGTALDQCLQTAANEAIVDPNTTSPYIGRFFIRVNSAQPPADDFMNFNLRYDTPVGQPVIFVREPGIKTSTYSHIPEGLPMYFGDFTNAKFVNQILKCTSQLNPPAGCELNIPKP